MYDAIGLIGRASVIAGFAATLVALLAYLRSLRSPSALGLARAGFHATVTLVIIASASLLVLILKHQYQFEYVWAYSARDLPFGLLASTFYAGQEGSFLLWTLMVAAIGVPLLAYARRQGSESAVMSVYAAILSFLTLLLIVKNPFARIPVELVPADGRGLNPLLQNFWMQIHPPILFLGFAAMAPPFALALAALLQGRFQEWVRGALPWVGLGAMVLGLGIALGGFWAYETLGWGGWWGWDPVENSSLIPWLVSVALLHTMLVQRKTEGLVVTNFILAILGFVLVLYSTFLTRSGVLGEASVHAFVDPGRFAFTVLVLFMFVFMDVGFAMLFVRFTRLGARLWERCSPPAVRPSRFFAWQRALVLYLVFIVPSIPLFAAVAGDTAPVIRAAMEGAGGLLRVLLYPALWLAVFLNAAALFWVPALAVKLGLVGYTLSGRLHGRDGYQSFPLLSRETFLGLGSAVVGVLTVIVLLGTSLPIVPQTVLGVINGVLAWWNGLTGGSMALGNTVQPSFYNAMSLPLTVLAAALTGLGLLLRWQRNDGNELLRKLIVPAAFALVAAVLIAALGGVTNPGMLLLACAAAFSLAVNAQAGYRVARGNPAFAGAHVAHLGVAFLLLGIIGSGYSSETRSLLLPQGAVRHAFGRSFTYTRSEPFHDGTRFYYHVVMADSADAGTGGDTIRTIMFDSEYSGKRQPFRTPGIAKSLTGDVYIEPVALQPADPEGGSVLGFTKGASTDAGGYRVTFLGFRMGDGDETSFTLGTMFRVEKGGAAEELTPSQTTGPDGVRSTPARTAAGDLELSIVAMQPDPEDLSRSVLQTRLRNPAAAPDPDALREALVVEVSIKPFISLVWLGIVLAVIGFGMAALRRARERREAA